MAATLSDDIFKCIFWNENIWISVKISLNFVPYGSINNIPALVQIMTWRRPCDKPLSESMMVNLPTHLCVTRPQWVNAGWWPGDVKSIAAHQQPWYGPGSSGIFPSRLEKMKHNEMINVKPNKRHHAITDCSTSFNWSHPLHVIDRAMWAASWHPCWFLVIEGLHRTACVRLSHKEAFIRHD